MKNSFFLNLFIIYKFLLFCIILYEQTCGGHISKMILSILLYKHIVKIFVVLIVNEYKENEKILKIVIVVVVDVEM